MQAIISFNIPFINLEYYDIGLIDEEELFDENKITSILKRDANYLQMENNFQLVRKKLNL